MTPTREELLALRERSYDLSRGNVPNIDNLTLRALVDEVLRLRTLADAAEALTHVAYHAPWCRRRKVPLESCDCGLDAALATYEAATEGSEG